MAGGANWTGVPMVAAEQNRQQFEAAVSLPNDEIDLAAATLLIARDEYPSLDLAAYLRRLDEMASEVRDLIGAERHPFTVAAGVARYLFTDLGFVGADDEYFDPRTSFLNDVMDRRRGIPISLSVVYMEVARRAGFDVVGIGLPGHFIVKQLHPMGDVLIDPFSGGAILSPDSCAQKVKEIYSGNLEFQPHMLCSVTKKQILSRTIHNLKTIYVAGRDYQRALSMVELLLVLAPWDLDEIRDRGMLRYRLRDLVGALDDLESYLTYCPGAADVELVRRNARAMRRMRQGC